MRNKNIGFSLQYQIREYLDYYWRESMDNKVEREEQILGELPKNLY